MDDAKEFSAVFIGGKDTLNETECRREMRLATQQLIREQMMGCPTGIE